MRISVRVFFLLLLLVCSHVGSVIAADQNSCEILFEDFSGSDYQRWLFDLPKEWEISSGKAVATATSDNYWAIAETSIFTEGPFYVDTDVSFNNENGAIALYAYTTGDVFFSIDSLDSHATDGVLVAIYPLQKKMRFTVWDLQSETWHSSSYYDITGDIWSIGMKHTDSALIFRLNGEDTQLQLAGDFGSIAVINNLWLAATGNGFQATFDNVCASHNSAVNVSPSYDNFSYVPYLYSDSAFGRWTGLALTNRNNVSNQVLIEYYSSAGVLLSSETKEIPANGQISFATGAPAGSEGWIKISSTSPLKGLALVGQSSPPSMFDMDLKTSLHTRLRLAHLAADTLWRSLVMICNPNNSAATITFKAYNTTGTLTATQPYSIPANGSAQVNLYSLFGQALTGSMIIEATQPVTAFLLYDSNTTTWKAGLSAIPVQ